MPGGPAPLTGPGQGGLQVPGSPPVLINEERSTSAPNVPHIVNLESISLQVMYSRGYLRGHAR